MTVPVLALLAREGEGALGIDSVELALGRALVGVEQGLQGVFDGETVVEVLDALPAEFDVDEALGRDRTALAGERTERPDRGQTGRDRHAESGLVVAVVVLVLLADADAERHTPTENATRQKVRSCGRSRRTVAPAGTGRRPRKRGAGSSDRSRALYWTSTVKSLTSPYSPVAEGPAKSFQLRRTRTSVWPVGASLGTSTVAV